MLKNKDMIFFVPHGVLHYLPLHALELNGEHLIMNSAVSYAPSASLLPFCRSKGSGSIENCASFGVVFEEEAEAIANLFGSKARTGELARKNYVKNFLKSDILHFSCHGYFNLEDPLSSGVILKDGVLTARELFGMRFNSELVTLSACETGINKGNPGDEMVGLTRALLYAGAPSVLVTLWSVNAETTKNLMVEFYRHLKEDKNKASALQKAQVSLIETTDNLHTYFWAPFTLIGDWEIGKRS